MAGRACNMRVVISSLTLWSELAFKKFYEAANLLPYGMPMFLCPKEMVMTDTEIVKLLAACKAKSNASWEELIAQFSRQLAALTGRIPEDELYSLLDIAFVCYQKGYSEFAAGEEARSFINEVRIRSSEQSH
jgi:hypothetical protein